LGAEARHAHSARREAGTCEWCLSARRGALPMKSDTTRYDQQINLVEAISMGDGGVFTKLLRNVSVIPKLKVCPGSEQPQPG